MLTIRCVEHLAIHVIAELTLILAPFADDAPIDLNRVRQEHNLPAGMLLIGLPLAIAASTFVAVSLFPGFSLWESALLTAFIAE